MSVPSNRPWFKFWPKGVPKHMDFPEIPLFKLLRDSAEKYPEHIAFSFLDRNLTYRELDTLTDKLAAALSSMTNRGDRTILFVPNIPEHVIGYYGVSKAGGIVSSISPLSKEIELEHQLNSIEANTIIVDAEHLPIVKNVQAKTKLKNIILTGAGERPDHGDHWVICGSPSIPYLHAIDVLDLCLLRNLCSRFLGH